jgi:hypothetical protein
VTLPRFGYLRTQTLTVGLSYFCTRRSGIAFAHDSNLASFIDLETREQLVDYHPMIPFRFLANDDSSRGLVNISAS